MSDIVERLKAWGKPIPVQPNAWVNMNVTGGPSVLEEAAAEITALRAERDALKARVDEVLRRARYMNRITTGQAQAIPDQDAMKWARGQVAILLALLTHDRPDWDDLKGIAPDATGSQSSEDFIRQQRDEWPSLTQYQPKESNA